MTLQNAFAAPTAYAYAIQIDSDLQNDREIPTAFLVHSQRLI